MIDMTHQLVLEAQKGKKSAMNQLFKLWYKRVYNIAFKYFSCEEIAKDVCQQTFIVVQNKLSQIQEPDRFKIWIYKTTINICHSEARRKKSRINRINNYYEINPLEPVASHEVNLQKKQQKEMVLEALQQIPKEQRTIIIMKEFEGLKFREIAEMLEISESTAKSRLYYGLKALRKIFESNEFKKEINYG